MRRRIVNVTLVLPDQLVEDGDLLVEDDRIVAVCSGGAEAQELDGGGALCLPGLVDLHCDAIEKEIEPRPKVDLPVALAIAASDRRNLTCGITTVFHGVSFAGGEWGVRDCRRAADLVRRLRGWRGLVDHRVHARYEVTDAGGEAPLTEVLAAGEVDLLSFMDHSPGQGQFRDMAAYVAYMMRTYHVDEAAAVSFGERKLAARATAPERIARLAALATGDGVVMASHDDDDAEQIAAWVATGVGIAEFPINLRAARAATAAGMTTLFGAPNILRGRSSGGNISAIEAVLAGACGGLCADYHPPALLAAALHLPGISPLSLPDAVRLVAQAPAEAAGLADRGAIVPGRRADLLLVAPGPVPQVEAVLVGGRLALDTQDRSIPACV